MDVELIEIVKVRPCVLQPFGIAEHRHLYLRIARHQSAQLGKGHVQLGRTACVEHHDIGLRAGEALAEHALARLQVGNGIDDALLFQLTAQRTGKAALRARRVVAVDDDGVVVLEALVETVHIRLVQRVAVLVHLEDVAVVVHFRGSGGERNKQTDVVGLGKIAQGLHLLRVQRTDNDVTVGSTRVAEHLADVTVLCQVPGTDVGRYTIQFQTVAGHQHAAIVFHHAFAVTIDVVQGQHDTHSDFTLAHILVGLRRRCCSSHEKGCQQDEIS